MFICAGSGTLRRVVGFFLLAGLAFGGSTARAASLNVTISDIQPGPGNIRVALYADADSFRHEDRATRVLSTGATASAVVVVFTDIPAGQYAVLAYHDANDNKKLDLRLGMFPEEGWGLSNDPTVIGPPRFSASAFDIAEPVTDLKVRLSY
jgi:uncharacterized protein (DUF2141 family)